MALWRLHVGGHVGGAVGVLAELQLPAGGAEGRSVGRRRPAGFGRSAPHRPFSIISPTLFASPTDRTLVFNDCVLTCAKIRG